MNNESQSKDFLWTVIALFLIVLVGYNLYSGLTVKKIGIPGIFMIEFGERTPASTPTPVPTDTPTPTPSPTPTETPTPTPSPVPPTAYLELILDTSGSMGSETFPDSGRTKMEAAKVRLEQLLDSYPRSMSYGLRVFGRPGRPPCDTDLLVGFEPDNADKIAEAIRDLEPEGWTPLAESIREAGDDIERLREGTERTIWVISDGKQEGCEDLDPCEVVKQMKLLGYRFVMDVIGLDVDDVTREQLSCIARAGDGIYLDVRREEELDDALHQLFARIDQVPPTEIYLGDRFSVRYPGQWEVKDLDEGVRFADPRGGMEITVQARLAEGSASDELEWRLGELRQEHTDLDERSYPVPGIVPLDWSVKAADVYFTRHGIPNRTVIITIIADSEAYFIEISGQKDTVTRFLEDRAFIEMIGSIQVW